MARPSGLNGNVAKQLLDALSVDGDLARACRVAGVPTRTVYRWLEYGEDPERPLFVAFRRAFDAKKAIGTKAKYAREIAALEARAPTPARTDAGAIALSQSQGVSAA